MHCVYSHVFIDDYTHTCILPIQMYLYMIAHAIHMYIGDYKHTVYCLLHRCSISVLIQFDDVNHVVSSCIFFDNHNYVQGY